MRLPADTVIPDDKITKYLLVRRPRGDKSVWLESAGYTNVPMLLDVRQIRGNGRPAHKHIPKSFSF